MPASKFKEKKPQYKLDSEGKFTIENYNFSKPFADFFPGIAGKYGVPMWVFYVNRAQAISSFGTDGKDHSILEFQSANKAWYQVFANGFRTFIKEYDKKGFVFYEPFHNGLANQAFELENKMLVSSYDLAIQETNKTLGLYTQVEYFTMPQDNYAALVRAVTFKNISKKTRKFQVLDGIPQIIPYGIANLFLKKLMRTIEAWMKVENLENNIAFYKVDVDPTDRPQVVHINKGNFYLGFYFEDKKAKIIKPIVDPKCIFGEIFDFSCPSNFLAQNRFTYPKNQVTKAKTPCGFSLLDFELAGGQELSFYFVIGNMRNLAMLNDSVKKITAPGYIDKKRKQNKGIIEDLQRDIKTQSSLREFDLYAGQSYLDNLMRGGYPVIFESKRSKTVFHLYSRKHGDLERDYNKFQIQPTYFSQGNGNYRDANQNRRLDVWFNPEIEYENITTFLNLIQTDGFNPLVVKGLNFILGDVTAFKKVLEELMEEPGLSKFLTFLEKPFTPGEIIFFIEKSKIKLKVSTDDLLNILLSHCIKIEEAEHGEGFWTDHWTYNLDLLESYLAIYPEKLEDIVFKQKIFSFYDNPYVVVPRSQKYQFVDGVIRQFHSVMQDDAKKKMIASRKEQPHKVRQDYGSGEIYKTSLINKIACVLANKLASLDPFGVGIQMEADKPNWFDSLNGLPGLFGSSVCETFELKRLIKFLKKVLDKTGVKSFPVSEEIFDFLNLLSLAIKENLESNNQDKDFIYWDKSYALKEDYRQKTKMGLSGKENELSTAVFIEILDNALIKLDQGIKKALEKDIYCGYFINEVKDYELLVPPFIKPKSFIQKKLPFFLEGQMHALRLSEDPESARKIYLATQKSELYDKKLKMYKVTASLSKAPLDIGRCAVFTPGWLENESIWLHMEYKYLLELLLQGLYDEFYADFKNVLIPFQNPRNYGRSILENSSFIASSAFAYKEMHGSGFVARLSGSNAEFLNMWLIMNIGKERFFIDANNQLNLKVNPILASWLFKKDKTYSFNFLSKIEFVFHNPKLKHTFGKNGVKPQKIVFKDKDSKTVEISSDTIPAPYAQQIRSRQIIRIDVHLQ